MTIHRQCGLIACLLLLLSGCGSTSEEGKLPVVPASGTLTIPDMDVSGLSIACIPDDAANTNAWAKVGAEGKFEVSTYELGDGAAVGTYKVIVSGGDGIMAEDDPRIAKIPAKYKSQEQTPWVIDVTADKASNTFDLRVE